MTAQATAQFNVITLAIRHEHDVVAARQRARLIAAQLGFDLQEQTRLATAVSEIARNAYQYAGGGLVAFAYAASPSPALVVRVADRGPGIAHLDQVLSGRYSSSTGMGLGMIGSKRLVDRFEVRSQPGGTTVTMAKDLPGSARAIQPADIARIAEELATRAPNSPFEEIQRQNQELVRALDELKTKGAELRRLNQELEDTNRGVLALYAELDEKAESLKRASETKTAFLSNMTHEFRTPVSSILNLSRLLLDRVDGPLNGEQEKQVRFIRRAAQDLSDLVNDLLDIAKVEAGKVAVRTGVFDVGELFGALRGILKPLIAHNPGVQLVFDDLASEQEGQGLPRLETDEGKVSQILRNLVSNALKYTEFGQVRVSARHEPAVEGAFPECVAFEVEDTGIGIRPQDLEVIFEEFTQIESPLQEVVKGTGLGLPLSRKLAQLLGGTLTVRSELGRGSLFTARIPVKYAGKSEGSLSALPASAPAPAPIPGASPSPSPSLFPAAPVRALIVDDDLDSRRQLKEALGRCGAPAGFEVIEAADGAEGLARAKAEAPQLIFLDINMPEMDGFEVLAALRSDPQMRAIPVIIHSAMALGEEERKRLEPAVAILPKKEWTEEAAMSLRTALDRAGLRRRAEREGVVDAS